MTPERMDPGLVEAVLADYLDLMDPAGDPELEAVKAAIFLEDALGITLGDAEIDPAVLGRPDLVRSLVRARTGLA